MDRPRKRRIRIASLVHGVGGRETGVRRLILDQAAAWSVLEPGVEIGLFVRCEAGSEEAWRGEPHVVSVRSSALGIAGRFVARELLSIELARWRPDVIYLRHSTISPSTLMLASAFPTVVGGDLDDLDELRIRSPRRYWYARATRDRLLRRARRIVVVTHELAQHPAIVGLGRPVSVLPNSIDLAAYPELPAPDNPSPRLVYIGSPGLAWAGVDKIARLASHFPSWRFDIVGPAPGELPDAPANVVVHGQLGREEYLPIMSAADVAIGPLALHRKALNEAAALKVAEYLACGIPVILGNLETAFPDGADFLLQLPNTEDNVEAARDEVGAFVERWRGHRIPRGEVSCIDSKVVERQRLDLILQERRAR
ncbi:MAG: glycosyltransferase [Chloroflexota bacterium]|nr:glycosyltransferase [Chloroflexota bacterium]